MIAFGPVPSRRLGQSLGINHIPPKVCSYNCVYCQVGVTTEKTSRRRTFYAPEQVVEAVQQKVKEIREAGGAVDYLSFVPDGEPTLDLNLGKMIQALRPLGIKVAVFTNATLLWRPDVREELNLADYVSVKVDTVNVKTWYKLNRPASDLTLTKVLDGIRTFCAAFPGRLVTETMLIAGLNDQAAELEEIARFVAGLHPDIAYLALPTRPPVQTWVTAPGEQTLSEAYLLFKQYVDEAECLTGFSPDAFSLSGDVIEDLLSITAVHPMRESEVLDLLRKGGVDRARLEELVADGRLVRTFHDGQAFYLRKLELV